MNKNTLKISVLSFALAALSGGIGYWAARPQGAEKPLAKSVEKSVKAEPRVLYWYDPMVPNQRFDKPGKSPFMDMQLVPQYAEEGGADHGADGGNSAGVKIDPRIVQNLGVRTTPVTRGLLLDSPLDVSANVQLNKRQVAIVQARSSGFVERVYARAPGDVIARGAPLVDLLVPEWAGAQNEFLAVLKTGDQGLIQSVRERLRSLGMSSDLIAQVEKSRQTHGIFTVTAPIGGLIQTLEVRTGMTVASGATLVQINGLDPVWIEADIPEAQARLVDINGRIRASLAAYPGESFAGKVIVLLPEANIESRTLRVRIELPNRDGRIKPGMFAQVRLNAAKSTAALLIPSEAVIRSGKRDVVLIALKGGRFEPVEVKLGQESNGQVAVLEGLEEGQDIVVSGQFLIDSEASLKGIVARMNGETRNMPAKGAAPTASVELNQAIGKIESIKGDELTIAHGPVKSLGWGAMTMSFKVARPDMATSVKSGDRVNFAFRTGDEGYVIEKMDKTERKP
ncbi:MAG TPA: efflux RND transporter periplasmic adaptor subunit [Rugosibacter sp.]